MVGVIYPGVDKNGNPIGGRSLNSANFTYENGFPAFIYTPHGENGPVRVVIDTGGIHVEFSRGVDTYKGQFVPKGEYFVKINNTPKRTSKMNSQANPILADKGYTGIKFGRYDFKLMQCEKMSLYGKKYKPASGREMNTFCAEAKQVIENMGNFLGSETRMEFEMIYPTTFSPRMKRFIENKIAPGIKIRKMRSKSTQ